MNAFEIVGRIIVNAGQAVKEIGETAKKAEQLKKKFSATIQTAQKVGKTVVAAGAAIGGAMVAAAETTREYRTEQAKLQTAFEQGGFSAETARKTYEGLNAVLGDSGRSVEAVNHLARLVDTEEELSAWTDICTGVFATFGDSLPIEGLTEAANETAKVGQVTGPLADALNWAGVSEDAFNESLKACSSEQERQALITSTLTDLYSGAAATYKETSADVMAANAAQDKLNASMAKIGAVLEPIITKGKVLLAEVLERAIPAIDWLSEVAVPAMNDAFTKAIPVFQKIGEFIKNTLWPAFDAVFKNFIVPVVGKAFREISQLWNTVLKPVLTGILDFITGVFSGDIGKAFEGIISIIQGIWGGIVAIVKRPINNVISMINSFIHGLNRLKVPDWVPGVGGKGINIPLIPELAKGGILERGQVGLLEGNGAEAVVPLDRNKAWIGAVANDMQGAIGGGDATEMLERILHALVALDKGLPEKMMNAFAAMTFDINNREFARLVKAVN